MFHLRRLRSREFIFATDVPRELEPLGRGRSAVSAGYGSARRCIPERVRDNWLLEGDGFPQHRQFASTRKWTTSDRTQTPDSELTDRAPAADRMRRAVCWAGHRFGCRGAREPIPAGRQCWLAQRRPRMQGHHRRISRGVVHDSVQDQGYQRASNVRKNSHAEVRVHSERWSARRLATSHSPD